MKINISNYHEVTINELVHIGKQGRENLLQHLSDVQNAVVSFYGPDSEIHPDFLDTLFDALEELGWDQDEFVKEWVTSWQNTK